MERLSILFAFTNKNASGGSRRNEFCPFPRTMREKSANERSRGEEPPGARCPRRRGGGRNSLQWYEKERNRKAESK
jgi:hypothetical protein